MAPPPFAELVDRIQAEELLELLQALSRCGGAGLDAPEGLSRIAFSEAETAALDWLAARGREAGLETRSDAIGNLYLSLPGAGEQVVQIGSHIDSVPQGGCYDGALGIVAGFATLRALRESGASLARGVELCCWRGEEHTYDAVYKGSGTAFGVSEPEILEHRYLERTLEEAIRGQGLDPEPIRQRRATLSDAERERIAAHLELHIEQAVRLEREGRDIGVVQSISGHRRLLVTLTGAFDHSGATAMGADRRDANLAMAQIHVRLDQLAREALRERTFVQTVGVINNHPQFNADFPQILQNAVTKVSGFAYFTFDLMATENAFMDAHLRAVKQAIQEVAAAHRVQADIQDLDRSEAVDLDPEIQELTLRVADGLGYSSLRMPSGAGHDSGLIATQRKPSGAPYRVGLIFVPCAGGISHAPQERCSAEQMLKGARVLCGAVHALAQKGD